jgi:hypothetical protein
MKKMFFLILSISLLFFLSYKFFYTVKLSEIKNKIYLNKAQEIKNLFEDEVYEKLGRTFIINYLLSRDEKIVKSLKNNNKSNLNFDEILEKIEVLGGYENLWIQIIDRDGNSFYRSWTDKVGDNIALLRKDIKKVLSKPEESLSISVGRFDMNFITIIPLYYQKQFIGMMEVMTKFNSVNSSLEDKGIKSIMLAHPRYKDQFIKPFTNIFLDNYYVVNKMASQSLLNKLEVNGVDKYKNIDSYIIDDNYIVTTDIIKDIEGKEMGYFILFSDINDIDYSKIYDFTKAYFVKTIIALIGFIIVLLIIGTKEYIDKMSLTINSRDIKFD